MLVRGFVHTRTDEDVKKHPRDQQPGRRQSRELGEKATATQRADVRDAGSATQQEHVLTPYRKTNTRERPAYAKHANLRHSLGERFLKIPT